METRMDTTVKILVGPDGKLEFRILDGDPSVAVPKLQAWTKSLGIAEPNITFNSDAEQHRHVHEDRSRVKHHA
jgi:hypothetical protein